MSTEQSEMSSGQRQVPPPELIDEFRTTNRKLLGPTFFAKFRPGGPWCLTAIVPDGPTVTAMPASERELERFLTEHEGSKNIYYTLNRTRGPMTKKPFKADIAFVDFLHADLDPRPGEPERTAFRRIIQTLRNSKLPWPTFMVASGNGVQVGWRLKNPVALPDAGAERDRMVADLESRNAAILTALDEHTGTQNIDRLLRLPNTMNLPNAKKLKDGRVPAMATLLSFTRTAAYDLDQFPATAKTQPSDQGSRIENSKTATVDLDSLPIADRWKELIRDPKHGEYYGSGRNGAVFKVLIEMVQAGCDDATMAAVVLDPSLPISEHVRAQAYPPSYAKKQIADAKDAVAKNAKKKAGKDRTIVARSLDKVPAKPIVWLWKDRIPIGKATQLAGDPKEGKSQILLMMCATVSVGGPWPLGEGNAPKGNVVILSAEDAADDTIKPRLAAYGADMSRIHVVDAVAEVDDKGHAFFSLATDVKLLEDFVEQLGDVKLLAIDPISAYMGKAGQVNTDRVGDVRATLAPLVKASERLGFGFVFVNHFNKNENASALQRISGSMGYAALARVNYNVLAEDPNCKDRNRPRLMVPVGQNVGDDSSGLAFTIEDAVVEIDDQTIDTSKVVFRGDDARSFGEIVMNQPGGKDKRVNKAAVVFLTEFLAVGARAQPEVLAAGLEKGFTARMLRGAMKHAGVISEPGAGHYFWRIKF
jgi:hypothetical protein